MAAKKTTTKKKAEGKPKGLTLYEIDDRIQEILECHLDTRTGEIGEEAIEELEALDMKRETKLFGYVAMIKQYEAMVGVAKTESDRLLGRSKAFKNYVAWLKARLVEAVPAGTEVKDGARRIWYRRVTTIEFKDDVKTEDIPHAYCKHTPEDWTPQTGLVRADLNAGKAEAVACAEVKRGWKLNID